MRLLPALSVGAFGALLATPVWGQQGTAARAPVDGGRTVSLGIPSPWSWTAGAASGPVNGPTADLQARLGLAHPIGNPVVSGLLIGVEGYAGARGGRLDPGLRARLQVPMFRVGVGVDHALRDGRTDLTYSLVHPGRRGGLFRDGTMLRFDWTPSRGGAVAAGLETPIFRQVPTGRTRPRRDHVRIPGPPMRRATAGGHAPAVDAALREMTEAARLIRELTVPFLGREVSPRAGVPAPLPPALRDLRDALAPPGRPVPTVVTEATRFHDALERAFAGALGGSGTTATADAVAREARRVLLHDVLLPYDRLLGQARAPDTIRRFGYVAQGRFLRWLHAEAGVSDGAARAALDVFTALLEIVEANRGATAERWGDARFAWLPLQYALRPEEHDEQAELDRIVELAVETPFSEGNVVSYLINEQFQYHLSRTIRAAEELHVLVTHDFRGLDDGDAPDEVAFAQTVQSYLRAMTDRVRAYDRTGRFPTYLILHDQWYYSLRRGDLFLRLLADPTRARVRLPRSHRAWEDSLAAAQRALREAIAASSLLQQQRAQYGEGWLLDLVKVHVTVTNRFDPSFWSWRLVPGLPMNDQILRDHRKLVFTDLSEDDPYRGEAIFTGAGVGEHYSDLSWEDRALLVRGPALLGLKAAARDLLRSQGVREDRIPHALRARPLAPDYAARVRAVAALPQRPLRALAVHNGSGYARKDVNVAKAVLYTLMPAGSVAMVPDSFWNAEFWGGALFGAALRGVRVLVIAPSVRSNSVEVPGTQLLSRELLSRMLAARDGFAPALAATGGLLQVGVWDSRLPVTDIAGKLDATTRTLAGTPWLRELFGFAPHVYAKLDSLRATVDSLLPPPPGPSRSKLHLKANFFASREAWSIMRMPEWGEITESFLLQRISQVQGRNAALVRFDEVQDPLLDVGRREVEAWYAGLPAAARAQVVFYSVMGSQNQNMRSMAMDAEDALVVAGWPSIIPYIDVVSLIGQSRWVTTQAEIDALLPPLGPLRTGLTHWGRLAY